MFYSFLSKLFIVFSVFMVLYTHKLPNFTILGTNINMMIYTCILFLFSILASFFFFKSRIKIIENDALKQKIKKETSEIASQEYKDKINRLNAKIETLETALKDALSKKQ